MRGGPSEGATREALVTALEAMAGALAALTPGWWCRLVQRRPALDTPAGLDRGGVRRVGARPGTRSPVTVARWATSEPIWSDYVVTKAGRIGDDGRRRTPTATSIVEWTIEGQRPIVDAGVFEYHPGPMRLVPRPPRTTP